MSSTPPSKKHRHSQLPRHSRVGGNPINLITDNINIWSSATQTKKGVGRGSSKKLNLYGIKKLRELILELAVRGLLVPQNPNDEPASILLEKIAKEKERLIKEKKIKKQKILRKINENEKKFKLPESWEWLRLADSYYSISPSGKKLKGSEIKEKGKFPVVDQGQKFIAGYTNIEGLLIRIPQPVVIFGDHTTNRKYIDFDFVAGADGTKILSPISLYPRYFFTYLTSYNLENRGYARHFKVLNDNLIAIPPIAEQLRIVTKVDELMILCDQLEQQQENSINAHKILVETLLSALTNAADKGAFDQAWGKIANHFDTLFTTEHSIEQLKQIILQLAVMGKLIPQDPKDEPASILLEKIAVEKERLIKEKKIKKQKELPEITDEEKPFELPNGWEWRRFYNIFFDLKYGTSKKSDYLTKGSPILRIPNVVKGFVDSIDLKFSKLTSKELNDLKLNIGDILIIRSNGSLSIVGTSAVVDDLHKGFAYAGYLVRVRLNTDKYNSRFINLVLRSKLIRNQIERPIRTTSGVKNINSTEISRLIMPIVPLKEQNRIVNKVDELMILCDQLKTNIGESKVVQLRLADAVAEHAINE